MTWKKTIGRLTLIPVGTFVGDHPSWFPLAEEKRFPMEGYKKKYIYIYIKTRRRRRTLQRAFEFSCFDQNQRKKSHNFEFKI